MVYVQSNYLSGSGSLSLKFLHSCHRLGACRPLLRHPRYSHLGPGILGCLRLLHGCGEPPWSLACTMDPVPAGEGHKAFSTSSGNISHIAHFPNLCYGSAKLKQKHWLLFSRGAIQKERSLYDIFITSMFIYSTC